MIAEEPICRECGLVVGAGDLCLLCQLEDRAKTERNDRLMEKAIAEGKRLQDQDVAAMKRSENIGYFDLDCWGSLIATFSSRRMQRVRGARSLARTWLDDLMGWQEVVE